MLIVDFFRKFTFGGDKRVKSSIEIFKEFERVGRYNCSLEGEMVVDVFKGDKEKLEVLTSTNSKIDFKIESGDEECNFDMRGELSLDYYRDKNQDIQYLVLIIGTILVAFRASNLLLNRFQEDEEHCKYVKEHN